MAYDEMNAGIEPGGLQDPNDVKILLCYLLNHAEKPLSFDELNEILQHDGLANYFIFAQSLKELLLSGHVDLHAEGNEDYYKITRLGKITASTFERHLPLTVREKSLQAALRLLNRRKLESENKVTITEGGNGYTVECRILDGQDELLAIRLLVPEADQARVVKEQFLEDPELLYKGNLAMLTGDTRSLSCLMRQGTLKPELPTVSIRPACVSDALGISNLILRNVDDILSKEHSASALEKMRAECTPEDILNQMHQKDYFILERNGALSAAGALMNTGSKESPRYSVSGLFVKPELQRIGLGELMLTHLTQLAKIMHAKELHAPVSRTGSGFYERMGFKKDDFQPDGADGITWMTKTL